MRPESPIGYLPLSISMPQVPELLEGRLPLDAHRPSNDGSDVYILEIGRRGRFLLGSAAFFNGIARDEREQWPGGQEPFRLLCHILKIH